ncbi:MAG TPA: OmpA family protein [Kineosporiaceae bacterium]|nr:OmpA family protein [Kineosporiaceae bacterium]
MAIRPCARWRASIRARLTRSEHRWTTALVAATVAALAAADLVLVTVPAHAVDVCGGPAQNDLTVTPTHDPNFYADLSAGFDASYLGYQVANSGTTDRANLWVTVDGFTGGAVNLADTTDTRRQIPALPSGQAVTTYFMVKATSTTTTPQTHTVTVYDRRPDLAGATPLSVCQSSFTAVIAAQSASANKVTAISVDQTTLTIGSAFTVTVTGETGQARGAMWVSPAAQSSWPTKALRLERTVITVDADGNGSTDYTFPDTLYIPSSQATAFTARTTYRAAYSFRVTAATASNPTVKPVAEIGSGSVFKHTGRYPALPTLSISGASASVALGKAVTAADLSVLPTTTAPNGTPGGTSYAEVPYRIRASTSGGSGTLGAAVDEFVDVPAAQVLYKRGSATITDADHPGGHGVPDPDTSPADTGARAGALHFTGPFTVNATTTAATLDYTMYVPLLVGAYTNQAFATLNGTTLGSTPTTVPVVSVTSNGSGLIAWTGGNAGQGGTSQTITFAQPPDTLLSQGTVALAATASSGLAVAFSTVTPAVCTVAGSTATLVTPGTCLINADQAGNGSFGPAPTVTRGFGVSGPQTITFPQPPDVAITAGSASLSATASSGLPVTFGGGTAGVCTVSGSTATVTGLGTCTVTADQAGNAFWSAAPRVTRTFAVTKAAQTITFAQPPDVLVAGGPFAVTATASSGLPVTFSSTTTGVCTVSGSTVTPVSAGTCTLNADQAGDGTYLAAPTLTRSFGVGLTGQTIDFPQPSDIAITAGSRTLAATASSGLTVTLTSATPGVCTVSGSTATLVSLGTCTISADQPGNAGYAAAATVTRSFAVTKAAQTITMAALPDVYLDAGTVTVTASASSGLPVALTTTTPAVCAVSGSTVTLLTAGTCTVRADQAGDGRYLSAATVSRTFTVNPTPAPVAQTITFAQPADTPVTSRSLTVDPTSDSGLAVAVTSSTPGICNAVAGPGPGYTVGLLATGTCTLAADQAGDARHLAAATVTRSFAVVRGAQSITFAQPSDVLVTAGTRSLSATATSGLAVGFSSSTTGVCTVSGSTVTLLSTGTCTIAADQAGNAEYLPAATVTRSFAVSRAAQVITFAQPADAVLSDRTRTVSATSDSGLTVAVTTTTPGVCTVSGSTVTLLATGTCTLNADQAGDGRYLPAATVTRGFAIGRSAQTITFPQPADVALTAGTATLDATASSGLTVSFTGRTPAVCTVSGRTATLLALGTCTVDAGQAGDAAYLAAPTVTGSFAVTRTGQTITFAQPPDVTLADAAVTLTASATSGLPVAFTGRTPAVCTVSGTTAALVAAGTCTVDAGQAGDGTYAPAPTATRSFTVGRIPQTITFPQPPGVSITAGTAGLSAGASSGLAVTFTGPTPAVCTVSGSTATLVSTGTCAVNADQAGDATFAAAPTVTRSFAVSRAPQTITFPALTDLSLTAGSRPVSAVAGSGLPVTFSSLTPATCTTWGSTVTLRQTGTCTVAADQPGNAGYAPAATVTRSFAVLPAVPEPVAPAVITVGLSMQVQVAAVSVPPDGLITLLDPAGRAVLTVTMSGQGTYYLDPATGTLAFLPAPRFVGSATPATYRITDGFNRTAQNSFTPTVRPLAGPDLTLAGVQGDTLSAPAGTGSPSGLDPSSVRLLDGQSQPVSTLTLPQVGSFRADQGSGVITFTPDAGFAGLSQVGYQAADRLGSLSQAEVTVTLAPLAVSAATQTVSVGETAHIPLTGVPATAAVSVVAGPGVADARYRDGQVDVTPAPGLTGQVGVTVTVVNGTARTLVPISVTVLPAGPAVAWFRVVDPGRTVIGWQPPEHPVPGMSYVVTVDGRQVARTTGTGWSLAVPLGPKSVIQVTVEDGTSLASSPVRAGYRPAGFAHILTVNFGNGSAVLTPAGRNQLNAYAKILAAQGFRGGNVVGFSDNAGSFASNLTLSKRRVQTVMAYLTPRARGVGLSTAWYGERYPVASNRTAAGKAANRRVELGVG